VLRRGGELYGIDPGPLVPYPSPHRGASSIRPGARAGTTLGGARHYGGAHIMEQSTKQRVTMAASIVAIIVAGFFIFKGMYGCERKAPLPKTMSLLCVNPDCGAVTEMETKAFQEFVAEEGKKQAATMMMVGPPVCTCPKCGKSTAHVAERCPKCDKVFLLTPGSEDFPDRCPGCGYSRYEEEHK
jgi:hypothetical protein